MGIEREQRYTRDRPCPICGGNAHDHPHCHGFTSEDGEWVRCTRNGEAEGAELDEACSPPVFKWKRQENGTYRPWTEAPPLAALRVSKPRSGAYSTDTGRSANGAGGDAALKADTKSHERREGERVWQYSDTQRVYRRDFWNPKKGGAWDKDVKPQYRNAAGEWVFGNGPGLVQRTYPPDAPVASPDAVLLVVEGEPAVDDLAALGFAAVTWRGGCGQVNQALDQLRAVARAQDVVLLPDAEGGRGKGRETMAKIAAALVGVAARVRILDLYPGDNESKRDVQDWLHDGGDADALVALIEATPDYVPPLHDAPDAVTTDAIASPLTLKQLMAKQIPPRREPVPGLISEGVTLFVGKAKLGKSWLLYGTALALAWGGAALGKIAVDRCEVLMLALEDGEARLQRRFRVLLRDGAIPDGVHVFTQWPRLDAGGAAQLDAFLAAHPAVKVVFIDTLAKVRPARKRGGDLYAEDYAVGEILKGVAERHGVALVVVHHSRKAGGEDFVDEVSGTTGLTGGVDAILLLRRDRGKADAVLCVSGRDVEEAEYALTWDSTLAQWTIAGNAEDFRRSQSRQDILAALTAAGEPLTPSRVAERIGQPVNAVKQRMWQMAKDGDLTSAGGKYAPAAQLHNRVTAITGGAEPPAPQGKTTVMAENGEHNRITGSATPAVMGYGDTRDGITGNDRALPLQDGENRGNGYAVTAVMAVNTNAAPTPEDVAWAKAHIQSGALSLAAIDLARVRRLCGGSFDTRTWRADVCERYGWPEPPPLALPPPPAPVDIDGWGFQAEGGDGAA